MRGYRSIYGSRNGEDLMRNHIVSHRIQIHGIILKNRFFHMEIMKIHCVTLNDEIQIVHIHVIQDERTCGLLLLNVLNVNMIERLHAFIFAT